MEEELKELKDKYGDIKYLTIPQVAEYLELDRRAIEAMIVNKEIKTIKIGKSNKVKLKVLAEYLGR